MHYDVIKDFKLDLKIFGFLPKIFITGLVVFVGIAFVMFFVLQGIVIKIISLMVLFGLVFGIMAVIQALLLKNRLNRGHSHKFQTSSIKYK